MISVSSSFIEKVNSGEIPKIRMLMTLEDSSVEPEWIDDDLIWADSISFSESVSQSGTFEVGAAIINSFNFSLNNFDGVFTDIDFRGATVAPVLYFETDGTPEYVQKGLYYISSHKTSGNVINITAMDAMKLFDNADTTITYPITVQNLISRLCTANGITLATQTIPNGSFVLNAPPTSESSEIMTDRVKLSYACQCIGCFARMDEQGRLVIGWYDFANPVVVTSTFSGKNLWTKPIEITGIKVTIDAADTGEEGGQTEAQTVIYGTDDYLIEISGNPYITTNNVQTVFTNISNNIFNKEFRPGVLPILSNPCLQAGDVLQVTDNITQQTYYIPISTTTYVKSIVQNIDCSISEKDSEDIRPSFVYRTRTSVQSAISQAQAADALARAAQAMAETSGYQPYIVSDKGTAFTVDTDVTLTAVIYDKEMNEVDPDGTMVIYRWWVTKDGIRASYLNGGKQFTIPVDDSLCEFAAGIYFETKDITEGVNPFLLAQRGDAVVLTNRAGTPLSVRAADGVVTS